MAFINIYGYILYEFRCHWSPAAEFREAEVFETGAWFWLLRLRCSLRGTELAYVKNQT